ncbi:MAG: DMT family transporter, partial [Tenacibaculum sp.]|nr:DMT family transporter [Tenacibaculum sp.]
LNGIFIKEYEADTISLYQLLFGVVVVTIYLGITGSFTTEFFVLESSDWLYLILLGSICTAYAFIASVKVMKYLTPYTVMLTINLEPIYAIVLALIVFGDTEQMNVEFYYGAFIVLFVVLLNGILKNSSKIKKKLQR